MVGTQPDGTMERLRGLFDALESRGDALAVIDETGRSWSHAELAALADAECAALPRQRCLVALRTANRLRALAAYVGALRGGHAVLLLGEVEENSPLLARFRPDFLHAGEGWRALADGAPAGGLHPDLSVLLATSGSTGEPKLVRLSVGNIRSNALAIAEYLELAPGERAITTLPFHYSYGMSVINSHLATGHALILNEDSVAEPAFWARFEAHGATSFAGVPHSFALLERSGFLSCPAPPSLRYFTQAGGRLPEERVLRFADFAEAEGRRFYVMYGQTEAAPRIAYVPPALLRQHPGAIGLPVPGGRINLLDERGRRIEAPGVEGELVYCGPNVMMGYATRREDLARGAELTELRTGDLAVLGSEGLFTITGRKSRFIKPFGLRIGLDDVEALLRGAGIEAAATGNDDGLQIAVVAPARTEAVLEAVLGRYPVSPASVRVLQLSELPRLASGKIDYAGLRGSFAATDTGLPAGHLSLQDAFAELLGQPGLKAEDSFSSAGGDSLNFISASLLVEERLGFVPEGWERMSLRELSAIPPHAPEVKPAGQSRLFFLDQVRTGLMLLGIPYHTALAYMDYPWIVKAGPVSTPLTLFAEVLNTFRMPGFFVLAGFFAMMFIDRERPGPWWRNRAIQLGIPLAATMLLLNPLIMLAHALNMGADSEVMANWLAQLSRPGEHWIVHVWFLVFLIAYYGAFAWACGLWQRRSIMRDAASAGDIILSSGASFTLATIAAGLVTVLGVAVLKLLGITFILWDSLYLSEMVSLLPAFAMGCLLAARRDLIGRFASADLWTVAVALTSTAVLVATRYREETLFRALSFFLSPMAGLFWARIVLFVALRWFDRSTRWGRRLVDASMTIYLVHLVFVVFLGAGFARLDLPVLLEFAIIVPATLALSLGFHAIVSRNRVTMLLFTGIARGRRGPAAPVREEAGPLPVLRT
ncbi:AMP-binding protein [Roseomonas sp. GCM10028921]